MLGVELARSARRPRSYAIAGLLAAVPGLLVLALVLDPPTGPEGTGLPTLVQGGGVFAAVAGLVLVQPFLLPLAASLLGGDAIAGEASAGTLRYLLVRPVGRGRLVLAKYAAVLVQLAVAVVVVAVTGLVTGGVAFGLGATPLLSGTTATLPDALLRLLVAGWYSLAAVSAVAAVGLYASTLTASAPGATVVAIAAAIIEQILGAIESVDVIHPYLLTTYWPRLLELFRDPVDWPLLGEGLLVFVAHVVLFVALAVVRVHRRDVHH